MSNARERHLFSVNPAKTAIALPVVFERHRIGKRREYELIRLSTVAKENVAHVLLEMEKQCTQLSQQGKVQIFCFHVRLCSYWL